MQLTIRHVPNRANYVFLMLAIDHRSPASGQERKHVRASNPVQPAAVLRMGQPINRAIQPGYEDLLSEPDSWISVDVYLLPYKHSGRQ